MKLRELNNIIESLERLGEIELLMDYYLRKEKLLNLLGYNFKKYIENTILSKGIDALNEEELEVAQYLYDNKEISI